MSKNPSATRRRYSRQRGRSVAVAGQRPNASPPFGAALAVVFVHGVTRTLIHFARDVFRYYINLLANATSAIFATPGLQSTVR